MNKNWTYGATAKDFVNLFEQDEIELIREVCDEFIQWQNLCSFNDDVNLHIGRAMSINYLFTETEYAGLDSNNPVNYISVLMSLINDYKWIMSDNYAEVEDAEDDDGRYCADLFYDRIMRCNKLLTALSNL